MRKKQREVTNFSEIIEIIDRCQVVRVCLRGDGFPYIVPLSFGWEVVDGKLQIYFHCAKEGKKIDFIAKDNAVTIEADILNGYVKTDNGVTADYESVIGYGRANEVFGDEAMHGLELLLKHCAIEGYSAKSCVMTGIVSVYRIDVETLTGKKRFKAQG